MVDRPEARLYPVDMWCEAWTVRSAEEDDPADETGFEADLDLPDEEPTGAAPARAKGRACPTSPDDAEGPLDSLDDEALIQFPYEELAHREADDALGPAELEEDDDLSFFEADEAPGDAMAYHDAEGPLQEEDAELALPEQDETMTEGVGGDEEGIPVDETAFDLEELPPFGADVEGEALFEEDLDDLSLEPSRGVPAPVVVPASGPEGRTRAAPTTHPVADRSPPT